MLPRLEIRSTPRHTNDGPCALPLRPRLLRALCHAGAVSARSGSMVFRVLEVRWADLVKRLDLEIDVDTAEIESFEFL